MSDFFLYTGIIKKIVERTSGLIHSYKCKKTRKTREELMEIFH